MTDISTADTAAPTQRAAAAPFTCARRQILLGAGVGGVVLVAAACGGSSGSSDAATTPSAAGSSAADAPASSGAASSAAASSAPAVQSIIALSEVPTDAAVSVKADGKTLLITQNGGRLAAFDATCPHQGCTVAPKDAILECPCHSSEFTLAGAVTQGPATSGLTPVSVKVESDQVVLA